MRRTIAVLLGLVLGAANAGATDIAGKWGIGASVFSGGVETSLIHGHSDRTAWVFDVAFRGRNFDRTIELVPGPELTGNLNNWSVIAGPSLRRYTRPASEFSPYGDVFVSFDYAGDHLGYLGFSGTAKRAGLSTGLAFGLEYFTRWHCSFSAHTSVLTLGWDRQTFELGGFGLVRKTTADVFSASAGLAPRVEVRAYF